MGLPFPVFGFGIPVLNRGAVEYTEEGQPNGSGSIALLIQKQGPLARIRNLKKPLARTLRYIRNITRERHKPYSTVTAGSLLQQVSFITCVLKP